jgi:4-hydroxybenzoate polyprenyltransferase
MAQRLMSGLVPPNSASEPREILRWVRRVEIVTGLAAVVAGIALWNAGWFHWLLIGVGLLGLSPWPGAQAILRRADRKPGVLVTDPERRRTRGRRAAQIQVPLYAIAGLVIGYLVGGLGVALFMGVVMGFSAALGAWLVMRRLNR